MAVSTRLSGAHAILLATSLCARSDTSCLPQLQAQFPNALPTERLLRIILTFLPESTEPQTYIPVLQTLVDGLSSPLNHDGVDTSPVKELSEAAARKRVRKIRLLPLKYPGDEDSEESSDILTQFLIHRAHRIDSETSLQPLILDLFLPFYQRSPPLRTWLVSCLLPLLRLNYEYYPDQEESFSIETLEALDDHTATNVLLSMAGTHKSDMDLIQNLRGLVGPWMYGNTRPRRQRFNQLARQNLITIPQNDDDQREVEYSGWEYVNEWLLSHSLVDPEATVSAFVNWDGPEDIDFGGYVGETELAHSDQLRYRYGQTGLSVVYSSNELSLDGSIRILGRVASLLGLETSLFLTPDSLTLPSVTFDASRLQSATRASLFQNALLLSTNPLTYPAASSISFLGALLLSLRVLSELGHPIPCRTAASICLHSSQDMQLFELRSVVASAVKHTKSGRDWSKVREQLLWLRDWTSNALGKSANPDCHGLFWRISPDALEAEILKAFLEVREYDLAVAIYLNPNSSLSPIQVEDAAKEAIFAAYDNASNGNRTRGKMQRAYEILQAFKPQFPDSTPLKQANALISATHALSFYSLTLQHGVPFQPVSIRVHPDPLSLIEKVLDQNPKSYTKLDDLLSIGRNLVTAGFSARPTDDDSQYTRRPRISQEDAVVIAERRIMSLAISSALSSDDFGTAYSYILTRLTPPSSIPTSSPLTNPAIKDDITWRAVYNAGRYRAPVSSTPTLLQTQIAQLTQRMELLSLALTLTPTPDPLPEILGAWRRCDEELSGLRARESEEADLWDTKGDTTATAPSTVPGGFGPTDNEQDLFETKQQHARRAARAHQTRVHHDEAPMGLFEVARGAALALHRNTLPLRTAASDSFSPALSTAPGHSRSGSAAEDGAENEPGRVRKRDVVSNMVTGGLASGIGWVLGAQPVNRQ
ncbi:hypothetical protein P175DRAFT_0505186 [Aspergillus ochraceoroseus IBT 24754]|uniref:Sec39 domain-containing protein n=2 Tax=Aspergillus ochraceoroseus TaxID=138278 RepID=A0A2T5LL85_9EURO|nr:uncharacterized protein P175DRAFT_0505186 [Aspergillus ochraceoroseus IBT 24754]KKK20314.1 hypothetical protein AOCH_006172 [Aspergillus ochraceoroseus]PTU17042.1 hypothetical protein P175DRAFT_0505186 [Aspergillus ochraceoroseus IBT 24754]